MDWTFKRAEYTRVLPALYSEPALKQISEFLSLLSDLDKRPKIDARVLLTSCSIVMCQPEASLWCPACVIFTRFVLLLIYPANPSYRNLFVAGFLKFSNLLSKQSSLKCWELENSGVYSFDEKHLSYPDKIWGASVDYLAMVSAAQNLALQSQDNLGAMERSRSLHQFACRNKAFEIPGPLTTQGNDLDLMFFLYGDQYYQYQSVHELVAEEFNDREKWLPAYERFIGGVMESVNQRYTGNRNRRYVRDFPETSDSHVSSVLHRVYDSSKTDLSSITSFSKDAILRILASVQQHYLEITAKSNVPVFDPVREAAQMARDLGQGTNLSSIEVVDAIATMRRSNTKTQTAQKLCSHFTRKLYQLPSPAYQQSLPFPYTYLSLQVLDIACQLRSRVFASLLVQDFKRLGIKPCAKFRRKLLAALATLPLYLETEGITTVTERICMLASHFAPVDFDYLDILYDKVIYLLVRDDERIDQLLRNLQDLTTHMLNPLATVPIELMTDYVEFLPIVEQICSISCAAFSVYWPIFEAIYDMVK